MTTDALDIKIIKKLPTSRQNLFLSSSPDCLNALRRPSHSLEVWNWDALIRTRRLVSEGVNSNAIATGDPPTLVVEQADPVGNLITKAIQLWQPIPSYRILAL